MTASGIGRLRARVTAVQRGASEPGSDRGKWSTLSNTTLGVLMATIDASIVLISLPDIFRGIHLNPLTPGNTSYFLWLLMGYLLVTAVLGINTVAAIAASFIGLVLGGILAPIDWRLVFRVSVPVGVVGSVWGYINLVDRGIRTPARIDWLGNATFAVGLVAVLVGIVYGIEPYGGHVMGWTNPLVLAALSGGVAVLAAFAWIETRVAAPMFRIPLFKIRAFTAGNLASLMAALGRGGLMFILIIWLQGIWLPRHGYSFADTPLWAGIYMLPLTAGFLIAGPTSGWLSDRFGARPFATGGMLLAAATGRVRSR